MNQKFALLQKYGSWALITGASSGIGYAYSMRLAEMGFNCIIVANDTAGLKKTKEDIKSLYGAEVLTIDIDLGTPGAVNTVLEVASKVDVGMVVSNAGYGIMGYFIQHPIDDYMKMISVNEEASIHLMHAFCKRFYLEKRKGAIMQITSANADMLNSIPFSAVYSAGKSMLKNITEAVHYEMKPLGIDVLNVAPGPTNTSFQDVASTRRLSFMESPENVVERSLNALGKKPNVVTNKITKALILFHNFTPAPQRFKTFCRAIFFSRILGKIENVKLPVAA